MPPGLIHHSDPGASTEYAARLIETRLDDEELAGPDNRRCFGPRSLSTFCADGFGVNSNAAVWIVVPDHHTVPTRVFWAESKSE
jgi:hypothetical protein